MSGDDVLGTLLYTAGTGKGRECQGPGDCMDKVIPYLVTCRTCCFYSSYL